MTACEVPNLKCKSYFNKDSMTNVISLVDLSEEYQITMDTKIDTTMCVHMKDKVIMFGQMHNRLHSLDPKKNNSHASEQFKEKFNKKKRNPIK